MTDRVSKIEIRRLMSMPSVMRWRIEALGAESGGRPSRRLLVACRQYYRAHLPDGSHMAFVAEYDGEACGCGGMSFADVAPSTDNPSGRVACLSGVYVRAAFAGLGVEEALAECLMAEARRNGCGLVCADSASRRFLTDDMLRL